MCIAKHAARVQTTTVTLKLHGRLGRLELCDARAAFNARACFGILMLDLAKLQNTQKGY